MALRKSLVKKAVDQPGTGPNTAGLTVAETADYLSKRQALGWPGSLSIAGRPLPRKGDR